MNSRNGLYGYLDGNLLMLVSTNEGYEYTTNIKEIISKYNFKERRSKYSGSISYRLKAEENSKIRAYEVKTFCIYNKFKFFIDNIFEEKYILRPLAEAQDYFKDFPRHGYDPVYEAEESELEEIWEEREAIEGFVFDVEPIVSLKKKET